MAKETESTRASVSGLLLLQGEVSSLLVAFYLSAVQKVKSSSNHPKYFSLFVAWFDNNYKSKRKIIIIIELIFI